MISLKIHFCISKSYSSLSLSLSKEILCICIMAYMARLMYLVGAWFQLSVSSKFPSNRPLQSVSITVDHPISFSEVIKFYHCCCFSVLPGAQIFQLTLICMRKKHPQILYQNICDKSEAEVLFFRPLTILIYIYFLIKLPTVDDSTISSVN